MLELRDIVCGYPSFTASDPGGAAPCVLNGVSFFVRPGERVAVLGPNGAGKSTMLRCAAALLRPRHGEVLLDGVPVRTADERKALRRCVGLVGQDPDNQMVASTVFEEVAFGPCNLGLPVDEVRQRVSEALDSCNLAGFEQRDVSTLSGGQRQRVALAGVLAMRPRYLLCDEPCSMLDAHARAEVLAVLDRAARQGCGVVQVTNELAEVVSYDRAVVLGPRGVAWEGTPADLVRDTEACEGAACLLTPWLRATQTLTREGLLPRDAPLDDPVSCAHLLAALGPAYVACAAGHLDAMHPLWDVFPQNATGAASPTDAQEDTGSLCVRGVSHSYGPGGRERTWALRGVNLSIGSGEAVVLAGRTGSGKSTLARVAAGLIRPTEGTAAIAGRGVRAGEVGYAFQRAEDQLFADTVLDDVMFGPLNMGLDRRQALERALRALERVGLDPDRFSKLSPFALSGGQMRRVALAGVVAMEAPYVVFDEPTVGLDARGFAELTSIVSDLCSDGTGVAIVTHDTVRAAALARRALLLDSGSLCWEGPAAGLASRVHPGTDAVSAFRRSVAELSVLTGQGAASHGA